MYYEHFGFSEPPFSISPDPRFLFMSERHREALAHLVYGAGENGGFVLLTGGVGTGKTTLLRSLLQQELQDVDVAMCLNPSLNEYDFIASILDELGIVYDDQQQSIKRLIDALNRHLLKTHSEGRQTVLIIDEAQNLSRETLEQVRLLTNLETDNQKLLRIILVGQEELQEKLAREDLRQLSQRITVRYHLTALNPSEVEDYIDHRISIARGNTKIFPASSMRKIYQLTNGIPRLINVLCDRALLGAYSEGVDKVAVKHINLAAEEALPSTTNIKNQSASSQRSSKRHLVLIAALLAAMGGGYYFLYKNYNSLKSDYPILESYSALFLQPKDIQQTDLVQPNDKVEVEITPPNLVAQLTNDSETVADRPTADVSKESNTNTEGLSVTESNEAKPIIATESTEQVATINAESATKLEPVEVLPSKEEIIQANVAKIIGSSRSVVEGLPVLLRLWQKPTSFPAQETPCDYIKSHGLVCSEQSGGFGLLTKINRPSLLELSKNGIDSTWIIVTGIENTDLQINYSGEEFAIPFAEIAPYWTGKFLTLLRKPNNTRSMQPNESGEKIRWLRQRLALANDEDYTQISSSLKFDENLVQKVKNFQSQHHLSVDGIVGNQTLLYLYNTLITEDTPQLLKSN